jgi:hypothetical protein
MTTVGSGGHVDHASGAFVRHGGTITTLNPGAGCTNQRFLVTGTLQNVSTRSTSGGSGSFRATLTHYRYSLLGHCVIYAARVAGTVSFRY